jgi:hypothetical protein
MTDLQYENLMNAILDLRRVIEEAFAMMNRHVDELDRLSDAQDPSRNSFESRRSLSS